MDDPSCFPFVIDRDTEGGKNKLEDIYDRDRVLASIRNEFMTAITSIDMEYLRVDVQEAR